MVLDIKTIIIVTGLLHFMQVLVFYHQYRINKSLGGPVWWLAWSGSEAIAFLFLFIRSFPAFIPFSIILTDPVVILGTVFIYIGLMKFFGKKPNLKFVLSLYVSFLLIHLYFYLVTDSIFIRTVLLNGYLAFFGFYTAFAIYKHKDKSITATANFNLVLFIIHSLIFTYRTVMIIAGTPFENVFAPTLFELTQYIDGLMVGLLWTFGFIIMLNQKLTSEISEAKNHFEDIFNLSPVAVLITDINRAVIVNCNEGFTAITGYPKEEVLGKSTLDFNIWVDTADRQNVIDQIRENGYCENYEARFKCRNGEIISGLISSRMLSLNFKSHMISVVRNITERKKIEEEIKAKNDELVKLNSEKEKLFSIIAHDLKTPFQGLIGYSEILANEYDSLSEEEKHSFIKSIEELSHSSFKLLQNLLEWTRMQTGQMTFNPEYFDLMVELHSTLNLLKQAAQNKDIDFTYSIDNMLFVNADKNMLSTIVRNLVSNSIKFTNPKGAISLTAEKLTGFIKFSVTDNGIGIAKENLDKLFKIDKSITRKGTANEEGTGLGLLLCKEMVEKHRGTIEAISEPGKGTTFIFTLPLNGN